MNRQVKELMKKIIPKSFHYKIATLLRRVDYNFSLINNKYKLSTSLSDNLRYPNFCLKASNNLKIFSTFRRNHIYWSILEHVNYEQGLEYIQEINNIDKNFLSISHNLEEIRKNDLWGNPKIYSYHNLGSFSQTTLRYAKVYCELIKLFSCLNGFKICEIGIGYGGQCRIITAFTSPTEYTLVDLKPVLRLAQTYLDNYIARSKLSYQTMNELEYSKFDLVISNYAFTELTRGIQEVYLNKIILNSKRGYITYNEISPVDFNSFTKDELLQIIPNSHIIKEFPEIEKNNCIIIWGSL